MFRPIGYTKVTGFLVLSVLLLVLAACGGGQPAATPTPTSAGQTGDAATPTSEPEPTGEPQFDAAEHFQGKTITLVVDFKPGGGTDLQARYFASNWGKYIPGNPKIEVMNLPPNPSGRNYVWNADPDGLTLSFLASAGVGTELVDPNAEFESAKFIQIGSHAKRDVVWLVRGTVPYETLPDANGGDVELTLAEQLGSVEDLSGKMMAAGMLAMWFDVPLRYATVATGGSADDLLMIERGDVNGYIAGSHWYSLPTLRPGWFADGYVKPIADMGHPDAPAIPNDEIEMPIPNAVTWLNDEQKQLWEGIVLPDVISGKGIAGPPDMPEGVVQALRDAYADAMNDPTFSAELADLQGQPVALVRGEKLQEMVVESTAAFETQLPRYEEIRQQIFDLYVR